MDCPECGHFFEVQRSLKGGLTNCPGCRQAVTVPGGPEPIFWVILGGASLAALGMAFAVGSAAGPAAGITVALILAGVIVIGVLAS